MSLHGLTVVEFAGLAPAPFAGLVLADNGANVIRIDRPAGLSSDILCRGKRSLAINLKIPSGLAVVQRLIASADVIIDPFRPEVMERLGLGPDVFLGDGKRRGVNERLIYARLVGYARTGSHANMAGHDINYVALSGVLSMLPGSQDKPTLPLNLLADFAGGGLTCVLGILLALIERGRSGRGQVVDTNMVQGTRYLSSFPLLHTLLPSSHLFTDARGKNILDGGAPFYGVYTCKDGGWMSVGCLEPEFFAIFIGKFLGALPKDFALPDRWRPSRDTQSKREDWPKLKEFLEKGFLARTRDSWAEIFIGTDACAVPVLTPAEASSLDASGSSIPTSHPLLSRGGEIAHSVIASDPRRLNLSPGRHNEEVLRELGLTAADMRRLAQDGALGDDAAAAARVHKL